jgi:hypothetical protein
MKALCTTVLSLVLMSSASSRPCSAQQQQQQQQAAARSLADLVCVSLFRHRVKVQPQPPADFWVF